MNHRYWCTHYGKHYGSSFKNLKLPVVMSVAWLNKTSLCPCPPVNDNLTSIHKVFLWELWDSAPYMRHQDVSHPAMHLVIGTQISVLALNPAGSKKQLQAFSATVQETLGNTVLDNHPEMKELLWKSKFQAKCQRKITQVWMHWECKKNCLTTHITLPQGSTVYDQKRFWLMISPRKVHT